jgi:hypothetical protein
LFWFRLRRQRRAGYADEIDIFENGTCPENGAGQVLGRSPTRATSTAAGIKATFHSLRPTHARPSSPAASSMPAARRSNTGLHAFRHFYASWCINRRADGGLELPLKLIQARLGHARRFK